MVQMLSLPPQGWRWSRQPAELPSSFPCEEGSSLWGPLSLASVDLRCWNGRGENCLEALCSNQLKVRRVKPGAAGWLNLLYSLGHSFLKASSAYFLQGVHLSSAGHRSSAKHGRAKFCVENCASVHVLALHSPCFQRFGGADIQQAVWHPGHPAVTSPTRELPWGSAQKVGQCESKHTATVFWC